MRRKYQQVLPQSSSPAIVFMWYREYSFTRGVRAGRGEGKMVAGLCEQIKEDEEVLDFVEVG